VQAPSFVENYGDWQGLWENDPVVVPTCAHQDQIAGRKPITDEPSVEYGAHIIDALEGGPAFPFYGNVRNHGLIDNLPPQAVVEVPCMADRNGIVPGRVGRIPPQLAAVMSPHVAVHELAVTGVLTRNRQMLYHAIAADPLTQAVLTLPQIRQLTDELLAANLRYAAQARGTAGHDFLVDAGRELARLLAIDLPRLDGLLRRIRP